MYVRDSGRGGTVHPKAKRKPKRGRPDTAGNPNVSKPTPKATPKATPKPRVKAASRTAQARAQERAYKSQGRAVEKEANRARQESQSRAKEKEYKSQGQAIEKRANIANHPGKGANQGNKYRKKGTLPDITNKEYVQSHRRMVLKKGRSYGSAPVLGVLQQTTRPIHAIAAGTRAGIHGKNVPKAAKRGFQLKDKSLFSNVLRDLGASKGVAKVGGFALDVAADPTTYLTGGTAAVIRKSAIKSAEKQVAKTAAAVDTRKMTEKEARRAASRNAINHRTGIAKAGAEAPDIAERALRRAVDQSTGKGVNLKFGGKAIPGVTRATATAGKPLSAAGRKLPGRRGARDIAADLNPNIAPHGVSKEQNIRAIAEVRAARAKASHGAHETQQQAHGIRKKIGDGNYLDVIDSIESGQIHSLPTDLQPYAKHIRSQFRYANRLRKHAGVRGGELANYVPHPLSDEGLAALAAKKKGDVPAGMGRGFYSKARKKGRRLPHAALREKFPGQYEEDLAKMFHERMAQGHRDIAYAELNRGLATIGRTVPKHFQSKGMKPTPMAALKEGEAVFHIQGGKVPREVTDNTELARVFKPMVLNKKGSRVKFATPGNQGGRYVILNRDVVKRAVEGRAPEMMGPGIVRVYDKTQGMFKRIAIGTPGFHLRNIVGDLSNAYLGQSGHRMPGNLVRGGRVLKAYNRQETALRNLTPGAVGSATLKTGRYGAVTYDELAKQLRNAGAFRSGYIARELPELGKFTRVTSPDKLKRAALAREDLPRLTTAIEALRQGATYKEAATAVSNLHFDYQHLTQFERQVMRRAMPFYTWSARNIPLQSRMVIQRPGKFANFEKMREEAVNNSGAEERAHKAADIYAELERLGVDMPKGWEKGLSEWEQRNASIPIAWKGNTFTVSAGLPIQDLNEFPGAALSQQMHEYYNKGMSLTGPLPKDFVEYFENHSFFFRDQLERDHTPLVPAPSWTKLLPDKLKKSSGWVPDYVDKRTGKKVMAWKGKADYLFKTIPGTPLYLQQLMTQGDRRGRTAAGKLLGWAGVRSSPYDPLTNAVNLAAAELQKTQKEIAALHQRGIYKANETPDLAYLNEKQKSLLGIIYGAKSRRGDVVLPQGAGSKASGKGVKWSDQGSGGGIKWSDQGSGNITWK